MNSPRAPRARFAYVGCFTSEKRKARGKGVAVFRIDADTGTWTHVQACDAIPNPGYIALDRTQRFLYSAHGDSSETASYARDPETGRLTFLNKQDTAGDNSSTVAVDASNRYVLLSTGPGVALFPRNADGSLAPRSALVLPHAPAPSGRWTAAASDQNVRCNSENQRGRGRTNARGANTRRDTRPVQ